MLDPESDPEAETGQSGACQEQRLLKTSLKGNISISVRVSMEHMSEHIHVRKSGTCKRHCVLAVEKNSKKYEVQSHAKQLAGLTLKCMNQIF